MTNRTREVLAARTASGERARFLLEVFHDGERWTSTVARLDEAGNPQPASVAPRFYGLTAEQARRRMLTALENEFDEVVSADPGVDASSR
jgi:hypothetical protein